MILYDQAQDVAAKAMRGHGITVEALASSTGIPMRELSKFLEGQFSADLARRMAPELGLCPEAFATLPGYRPATIAPVGVTRIEVPFEEEMVNIWLVESGDTAIVIDAGFRPDDLDEQLAKRGLGAVHLLLTHEHRDHVGGLGAASARLVSLHARSGIPLGFPATSVDPGQSFKIGPFNVEAFELRGHHPHALGYRVEGPGLALLAVGDAVFAGSIGGCRNPHTFEEARQTIEGMIEAGHQDHFVLTGHGAGTSLASEIISNPFLAAWAKPAN